MNSARPENASRFFGPPSMREAASSLPDAERRGKRFRKLACGAAAALVCIALMAAVAHRAAIVREVPGVAPLYALIGLPVNLRGLALHDVRGTVVREGARQVLAVVGEIANVRDSAQSVPDMRVAVRAADGHEIYAWTAAAPKSKLDIGESVAFRTRLAAPPAGAREVAVSFAEAAPAAVEKGSR